MSTPTPAHRSASTHTHTITAEHLTNADLLSSTQLLAGWPCSQCHGTLPRLRPGVAGSTSPYLHPHSHPHPRPLVDDPADSRTATGLCLSAHCAMSLDDTHIAHGPLRRSSPSTHPRPIETSTTKVQGRSPWTWPRPGAKPCVLYLHPDPPLKTSAAIMAITRTMPVRSSGVPPVTNILQPASPSHRHDGKTTLCRMKRRDGYIHKPCPFSVLSHHEDLASSSALRSDLVSKPCFSYANAPL
ncbi:hypothetical protein BKA56DRAFT_713374 [Ilyonectria sp. MPI-CAGE-AT-0026]|nr:hypothetical protein BKA56DRAFT_713374 [Ilyonectria sp. MPI-CAGE-AT-0026]